jgi:hypothetical protein
MDRVSSERLKSAALELGFTTIGVAPAETIPQALQYYSSWLGEGYQADMETGPKYSGILYEEKGRGILAERGQQVVVKPTEPDVKKVNKEVTGSVGNSQEIQDSIKIAEWNDYVIIAKGNHLEHFINGKKTVDVTDEDPRGAKEGILALQMHAGAPMVVEFKDIKLKAAK